MLFDELLEKHIGAFGKYQILILMLLGCEEVFLAMQVIAPVFLAATPRKYWCRHPQINNDTIFGNCSLDDRLRMTIPPAGSDEDAGDDGLSHCYMYNVILPPGSCPMMSYENDSAESLDLHLSSQNISDGYNEENLYVYDYDVIQCQDWIYDTSVFTSTIVTEWQFVCGGARKTKAKSISSLFLTGRIIGNSLFGWMVDRFGRRPIFMVAGVISASTALISAFIPWYIPFAILRFFLGIFITGKTNAGFIMALEFSGTGRRVIVGAIYFIFWSIGLSITVGVAYLIRDWRHLLIAITVPEFLVYIVFYFVCPESPRWLYVKNRTSQANKIISKMAKVNGTDMPKDLVIDSGRSTEDVKVTPMDLVRTSNIRKVTLSMFFINAVCGFAYYALVFGTSHFGDSIFTVTVIACIVEVPACLAMMLLFEYGKRIPTFSSFLMLAAACMLGSMPLDKYPDLQWLQLTLVMVGKFAVTAAFNTAWIYTCEVYPTGVRSMGVTWTDLGARVTSPLGPFLILLAAYFEYLPSMIIGGLTLLAGFVVLLQPETRGHPMPQVVEEMAVRKYKFTCCMSKDRPSMDNKPTHADTKEAESFLGKDTNFNI